MRKLIVSLLLVACYSLGFTVRAQEKVSETIIEEGISLYDEGKYQEAIDLFRQVNENDSNYVWMLSELSMTFLQTQNYDSAVWYADKGLQFPSGMRQHLMRSKGTAYDAAGQHDKCIEVYQEAIKLYPYSYLLHYNLGMTYLGLNDYVSAMNCFQESIRCNPFHASSHMRLGMLMARQENYTRAMLSLETFLALEPRSDRSNVILIYLENLSSGYVDTTYGEIVTPFTGNNIFEELDGLIRAKIVLNDRYKPVIKFNANVVKQTSLLMEMLPFDGNESDFWTETYLPLFRAIRDGGFVEPFLYTILSSSGKDEVVKWMNKNKKTLEAFYKTGSNLTSIRKNRTIVIDGKEMTLSTAYDDDGNLMSLGNMDASGKETGPWRYFFTNGELKSGGDCIGGERTGQWFFNTNDGLTETIETYSKGVLNGAYISYHPTGKVNVRGNFVNGEVDGKAAWHNVYGVPVRTLTYENDALDGEARTYYNSGQPMEAYTYQKDQITGKKLTYYPDGNEFILANYISDNPDGEYIEYHPNGRLSVKGTYRDGKEEGEWSYYFLNGKPRIVQNFTAGTTTGLYRSWYYNGMPETEAHFSSTGKQDGLATHYDHRGRKILEEEYQEGLLVKMTTDFTNPAGPAVFGSPDGTFSYRVFTADGKLRSEGSYDKGIQSGEIKIYYNNGNLRQKALFREGKYDGEAVTFHPNGKTEIQSYYKDGSIEGKYTEYGPGGIIVKTGFYLHDNMNNYWNYYDAEGNIENSAYYLNGLLNGWYTTFAVDGKVKSRDRFMTGNLIREYQFDSGGNIINDVDIVETNKYQIKGTKDIVLADCSMKGGLHDGPLVWYHPGGTISTEMNFLADNQEGTYKQYFPDGKLLLEGQLVNGNKEGLWTAYSQEGIKEYDEYYFMDMQDSIHHYYYDDGSLRMSETYFNDELDGETILYAPGGQMMVTLIYSDGELEGYRYMKQGKLTAVIPITEGDQSVKAWYDNGQLSFEQSYRDFVAEGPQIRYYPDGKIMWRREYSNGQLNGKCEKYYPDGKPQSLYFCKNGLYEGLYTEYSKTGSVKETIQYLHDQRNGKRTLFDGNGDMSATEEYWSNNFTGFRQ